jgi:hypothetical protein
VKRRQSVRWKSFAPNTPSQCDDIAGLTGGMCRALSLRVPRLYLKLT